MKYNSCNPVIWLTKCKCCKKKHLLVRVTLSWFSPHLITSSAYDKQRQRPNLRTREKLIFGTNSSMCLIKPNVKQLICQVSSWKNAVFFIILRQNFTQIDVISKYQICLKLQFLSIWGHYHYDVEQLWTIVKNLSCAKIYTNLHSLPLNEGSFIWVYRVLD